MKIAIIGAGYGALAAAFDLSKFGDYQIEIIEADEQIGGLVRGFQENNWQWTFEEHYHHAFDTDKDLKKFLEELGLREELVYKPAKSSTLYKGKIYQIDSPLSLLKFKQISLLSRLRTGAVLAFLKLLPNGTILERFRASDFLLATMGKEAWKVIWEPLFSSKFGRFKNQVNLSWFWARVNPRTKALGYFNGGFQRLNDAIFKKLKERGVVFSLSSKVKKIDKQNKAFVLQVIDKSGKVQKKEYDLVISTLASPLFTKIINLPELKKEKLQGLGAMTVALRLSKKLLEDGTYWLNVNEKKWPFVAIVEHDNLVDSQHYGGESLVYLGRYLEVSDSAYKKNINELIADYRPYLQKLNPAFDQMLIEAKVFKAPFAQPISFINQSKSLPSFNTSVKNLYWVCMQHIYPFDRGINHAVASGRRLAKHVRMESS